jgi:hypothetical protein
MYDQMPFSITGNHDVITVSSLNAVWYEFPDDIIIAEKYWKMISKTNNLQETT